MMLLVDIGNTRIKWATCVDGVLSDQRAAAHAGWSTSDWQRALFDGHGAIERVLAATVAGEESRHKLQSAALVAGVRAVDFASSKRAEAGVRNAYRDPRLLGVDRWVAAVGAFHLAQGACCVVDIGTAATVDAVAASGQHLGGFIVPGPAMMVTSLHAGTSDLAAHTAASTGAESALFADNTRDAIERGCRVALAALVDRACLELARLSGAPPRVFCTGGAIDGVLPYVLATCERVPDLVLRGLARIAQDPLEPRRPVVVQ